VKEALYYEKLDGKKVKCLLCPHFCVIADGKRGSCRARANQDGVLYATTYARVTSAAMDPIEKKPLYHFHPGTVILSLGTVGCNFKCDFCQNWQISQADAPTQEMTSQQAVQIARQQGSVGIAYTYNEPLIWFEYVMDTARLARENGLKNVLVTNGFINPEPLEELLPLIDALNIDLKSINPAFYKERCKGALEPVLKTAARCRKDAHVEVTNLIIPGYNDSDDDFTGLADWIADNLGDDTPTHLSAYTPRYKLGASPTEPATLLRAHGIFTKRLQFVYIGNVMLPEGNVTKCRNCGAALIARAGYRIQIRNLSGNKCELCGAENNIVN